MIRILIVDDHPVVREGLKLILSRTGTMEITGEAADGAEASVKLAKEEYDMVLLDIALPGRNGMDVLKEIKKHYPKLPVLVCSMHGEEEYGLRALRSGASGYLTKKSAANELVAAVHKVLQGGKYISQTLAEKLADAVAGDGGAPHQGLSDREYQVLCMIASGMTVGEIAREMSLNIKTVSTYRTRILIKMNMKSNADLNRYAIRNNLI
ncbi:response regulator transcription factor [Geomonas sp.]|uniref:response regulator transcription factor n=1 Tax=Geomonas sp. TaxID=2651584 RepID=UPI002B4651C5|nr:response regulator transcription factor [Geomonas sp.]HJV35612.1 response regulator transcription factor [Geomonas sp.]